MRNRFWAPPPPAKADIATAILTNVIEHLVLLFCPPISTPSPPKRCGRIFTLPICWMLVHLSYYATLPNKIHPGAFCVFSEAKTATSSRNRAQALRMKPLQCWGAKGSSGRMRFLSLTALQLWGAFLCSGNLQHCHIRWPICTIEVEAFFVYDHLPKIVDRSFVLVVDN